MVVTVAAQVALAHRTALPGGILERRYVLLLEIALWTAASVGTVLCLLRLPRRLAVGLLLVGALVVRLAAVSDKAPLSDDLYRYAWDGVVQSEGIDPYRYVPESPRLAPLRDVAGMEWIWPADERGTDTQTKINRANVRTIYPPVAEAWFWLEHQLVPLTAQDRGYEGVGLLLDIAVLACLLALCRDPRWAAVYGLTPLPVLEAVQNAHVDVLGVLLVLGAVALERRGRTLPAAAVLALAALVKVYPALLFPLLMRRRPVAVVGVAVGVAVLSYLPHVLVVGTDVVGYLPGYLSEEQYGSGSRYLLVSLLGVGGPAATVLVAAGVLALVGWALRTALPLPDAGVRLLTGVFLLVTPVQPWYSLLLVALVALSGWWPGLAVAAAAYPLFFATILDGPADQVGRLSYGAALLVVAVSAGTAARRARRPARP
ncbi:MAG: hypothetical protein JWO60_2373 [Frankiales bacterium]|nr:hypothetical protein [Frankiales bacterium]